MEEFVTKDATVLFDAFHAVSKIKPQHFEHCIIIWEDHEGNLHTQFAYYDEKDRRFRDGRGGSQDEKVVRYWIPVEQGKSKLWPGDGYSQISTAEQLVISKAGAGREKMRLSYDTFYDLQKVIPQGYAQCILVRRRSDDKRVSFGIYEGSERGFYDVMWGHCGTTYFDYWTDIELCGKLAELTAEGEKVLLEPLELKEDKGYYILIDEDEEDEEEDFEIDDVITDGIRVLFEGFHAVPEVKPQDGERCIVFWEGPGGYLHYGFSYSYNEKEHCFDENSDYYLDEKDVQYWIPLEQGKAEIWTGDGYSQIRIDEQLIKSKAWTGRKKLRLSYDFFYNLHRVRPLESTRCILVRARSDGTERVSFGTYEGRERGFCDAEGGHWDVTYFDYWADIEQCGKMVELTAEGETVLCKAEGLVENELDNHDGLNEDDWDE